MDDLVIKMTQQTPEVVFRTSGALSIKGVSIPENTYAFYKEAMHWLDEFDSTSMHDLVLDLDFEYLNTASTRSVIEVIKKITKHKRKDLAPIIKWHYEAEDDDALELGQDIEFCVEIKFQFVPK